MKSKNLLLGAAVIALGFVSCKNADQENSEKSVEVYTVYVDSIEGVSEADARANWAAIEAEYERRNTEAEAALAKLEDRAEAEKRLAESRARYETLRTKYAVQVNTDADAGEGKGSTRNLRSSFFGSQMGTDMNMDWVNKDNILKVYNDFYNEFDKNKDNYSREDYDEIKALYEALDARKNTVEKEGLSAEDNRKIAELKFKFGPKFDWNRMGAKANENEEAKDK
ncbi:MAG TPA: hypothetical protein VGB44_03015 [Flavobacterium sp.]|jgi:hypothetical protein